MGKGSIEKAPNRLGLFNAHLPTFLNSTIINWTLLVQKMFGMKSCEVVGMQKVRHNTSPLKHELCWPFHVIMEQNEISLGR